MSTDAPPPKAAPKRLPGLWIICVLNGLAGMLCLTVAFSMAPLAALIEVTFALANFTVAVALYLRLRGAWIGALALLGVTVAWSLAPELLSGRSGRS